MAATPPARATSDPADPYLVAGNARLQAGDVGGAIHDLAIARALNPARRDVLAALSTAEARQRTAGGPGPTPTPVAAPPVRLVIPAIGVNAAVERVGLTPDGGMDVPKRWEDVAWYQDGPGPGQVGNAAIAGHLDSDTGPAVFWRLRALAPGDRLLVILANEQTVTFAVRETASYPYDQAPLARIFGAAATANLNLITCNGTWDAARKNYSSRIVAYAIRV